ncbi:MAG: DUF523 domain-containing protein [bacterium]|nr:DUF523 domain-containing protein [bacterium]
MVIVSACLSGLNCRYDGSNRRDAEIEEMSRRGEAFPLCPEELGGLPIPRSPCEIETGDGEDVLAGRSRVLSGEGKDVTACFLQGAWKALAIARALGIAEGIFKAHSPSCGVTSIRRKGELVSGPGVCAALLLREGIALSER